MTSLTNDIQDKLKNLTAFEKLIAVNVIVYFLGWLISVTQGIPRMYSLSWLELPKDLSDFIIKPWSLITYGFAHTSFWHLFFNVMVLYFVGRSFSNLFKLYILLRM